MASKEQTDTRVRSLREVIASLSPERARGYRLMDSQGNRFPGADQISLICQGRVELPTVAPGTYTILFFDRDECLIPNEGGAPEPQVEIDRDLRVTTSPAEFDEAETFRSLRIERRQINNQGYRAVTETVASLANSFNRMQGAMIEREQSQSQALRNVIEVQEKLVGLHDRMVREGEERARAAMESEARLRATLEESIQRFQARSDWAGVIKEGIKEVSNIAQVAVMGPSMRSMSEGRERSTAESGDKRLAASKPAALPPASPPQKKAEAPKPQAATSTDTPDDGDWFLSFFGLSDGPPASATPTTGGAPADKQTEKPQANSKDDSKADSKNAGETQNKARTADAEIEAADAALRALDDLAAKLDQAVAQLPPSERRPVEPWTPAWAWREIKRRLISLSDGRIAWLTSSRYHVLEFLRELGAIARPPMLAAEGTR